MPFGFIPRDNRSFSRRAQPYNGRTGHLARGNISSRSLLNMKNHLAIMITTVISCAVLAAYLVYDLVVIYKFFSELNQRMHENLTANGIKISENKTMTTPSSQVDFSLMLKTADNYHRQRALGAALLVLLFLQALAGVAVYFALEKKQRFLLIGYLILTFPVMTFAMVYAIIFMVDTATTFVYVKIVSVILVYTIQANLYRLVYRMYQMLKYESRRNSRRQGESNDGFNQDRETTGQPPIIQLKPPPYEKEPPPYSLESPVTSVQQNVSSEVPTSATSTSRHSLSYGIGGINPSGSAVYDFSPDSVHELTYGSSQISSSSSSSSNNRLTASSLSTPESTSGVEPPSPPYSVSVEPCNVSTVDREADAPPPYTET